MSALVTSRGGLGDAIYTRPFVREAVRLHSDVHVETSWPEMFADLPVRPVKRVGGLAVQAYHGEIPPSSVWHTAPPDARRISLRYRWSQLHRHTVIEEMQALSNLQPRSLRLDLPPLPDSPLPGRYAIVRPPAARLDYAAPSREPLPEYLAIAANILRAHGHIVATLGAFVSGLEEPSSDPLPADVRYEYGELSLMQAFALVANASLVVCGPCWLVPAAVAARIPLLLICGGCGGRNNPRALIDARFGAPVEWLQPDQYCMCRQRFHACPKTIANFPARLAACVRALHCTRAA